MMSEPATISIIGCGKKKSDDREPSWKLYDANYTEAKIMAGMVMGVPYIASAKYGLVSPIERIDPYDETNNDKTKEELDAWGKDVVKAIPDRFDRAIIFGGRDYAEPIVWNAPETLEVLDPFSAHGGNGKQMGWCLDAAAEVLSGASISSVMPDAE